MRSHRFDRTGRIAAGVFGLIILAAVLLSAFYIAAEAGHDCSGEDCPVCAVIIQCERTLHQISGGAVILISEAVPVLLLMLAAFICTGELPQKTLVSSKIRLND